MYRFQFKPYRRSFAEAFANAKETFRQREGILLRLEDADGRVGFGEAAPLPSFGTESFAGALAAAASIGESLRWEEEGRRSDFSGSPALLWALESALGQIESEGLLPVLETPWPVCGLLGDPTDRGSLERMVEMGYRCCKLKIGKGSPVEELRAIESLLERFEGALRLRLDANGSLSLSQCVAWLQAIAEWPVEYLEQPLAKGLEAEMARVAGDFPTPLALDESVCQVDDLKRMRDGHWQGVFVVKPSLAGSRSALRDELSMGQSDVVFSSAFETAIGMGSALSFALDFQDRRRPLGFGVDSLFADRAYGLGLGAFLQSDSLPSIKDQQNLWNQI